MNKARIRQVKRIYSQADNAEILSVEFDVLEEGNVVATFNHGFPLATDSETIKAAVLKAVETFFSDRKIGEESAKLEADSKVAEETIKELKDLQL